MKLIEQLQTKRLLEDWIGIIDWLLDGNHFSDDKGWDKNKVTRFTKKVKRLPNLSKDNWIVDANKRQNWNSDDGEIYIRMNSDSSEGRSLVRHIRNSVAHGNCVIVGRDDKLKIKIEDFHVNRRQQTCSMILPITHIENIYAIYQDVEKTGMTPPQNRRKTS